MIVDTFMFYNELDVLELRLSILDQYVDTFVLVESEVTHIGTPKELYFEKNKERYARWLPKIRHVIARDMPTDNDPWSREKHQRHCVLEGLEDIPDDATIMISDVDEIPNMNVAHMIGNKTTTCHMHMFEYSFKYTFTGEPWFGTVMTSCKEFKALQPNFFRDFRWRFATIPFAGWHLSSFGDADMVYKKLKTYAHANDPGREHQTLENIKKYIEEGIHHTGGRLIHTPPDTRMPPRYPCDAKFYLFFG
jgi:beta-1,4-mannosyl-glycoprotein beta-1,4-N-acetylglucosaminyltransferase